MERSETTSVFLMNIAAPCDYVVQGELWARKGGPVQGRTASVLLRIDIQAHFKEVSEWDWLIALGRNVEHIDSSFCQGMNIGSVLD